jgi:uncharacterized membrane protein
MDQDSPSFLDGGQETAAAPGDRLAAMTSLVAALAAFFGSHLVPALPALRRRLVAGLGWRGYLVAYSALSLGVLAWVGHAYLAAPYVEVWPYAPRLRWVPLLVMPAACVLLVAGLVRPNPLSISLWPGSGGAGPSGGLFGVIRHPVPWAFALWAVAHGVPNGDGASLVLFGAMAVLAVGGMHGLDAKRRRLLGAERWRIAARRQTRVDARDLAGVGGGLLLYAVLALLHEPVLGLAPWPPAVLDLMVGG